PHYGYNLPGGTLFADVNGDGYPDVVIARNDHYSSHSVYLNKKGLDPTAKGWVQSSQWQTPSNVDFTNGYTLVDLNGDGLPDIYYLVNGNATAYMNNGHGWFEDSSSNYGAAIPNGDLKSGTVELIDVNGDGLVDLICSHN